MNVQLDILNGTFTQCLDDVAPFVTKEIRRPFTPWLNDEVRASFVEKNSLHATLKLIL